jgi:Domain of unknown function (DUF5060)/Cellulase (glycosyl hydrolase family 5)
MPSIRGINLLKSTGTIVIWLVCVMFTQCNAIAQDVQVAPLGQANTIKTFEPSEWTINAAHTYHNPFDPAEVTVDATFTSPAGTTVIVPAFWDAPDAPASPGFFVRFSPDQPGTWSFEVTVTDANGRRTSQSQTFTAQPSQHPGFIRRAANNRYLRFDSGQSYFPVGINLCWPPGKEPREQWYDTTFQKLADNGGNYVRVWVCHPPFMLESPTSGLGRYDLANAAFFDHLLASAQQHGIGVMLCMMNHRELLDKDMWGPAGWPTLPYNAVNGGPATRPIDFFENPGARRDFKARLRYIVARYSAYTSVAFWEVFNEQEFARVDIPLSWNREMTDYLRQVDPAKHLITTSAAVPPAVWELPSIDLTQTHFYGDGTQTDLVGPIAASFGQNERFNKPHLVGELGLDFKGPDTHLDPTGKGTSFHNGLWGAMLSGNAGSGIYWWWDSYVGPKNLWHEFKPVSDFASHIDWASKNFAPIPITELWRSDVKDTYADLTLLPSGSWGATQRKTIVIPGNGRTAELIPRYLYGPPHTDVHSPLTFEIDLPQAGDLILGVAQISDYAVVRVSIDGKPVHDFSFSALPGSPDVETPHFAEQSQLYQSDVNKDYHLPLTPGHHSIKLDPIAGDWITFSKIAVTNALAARYAGLDSVGVQDPATHETLVWILNTKSNWKDDQSEDAPAPIQSVELTVPNIDAGNYIADWFDTRSGEMIHSEEATPKSGVLSLHVPTFNRDIALRLQQRSKS